MNFVILYKEMCAFYKIGCLSDGVDTKCSKWLYGANCHIRINRAEYYLYYYM